MLGGGGDSRGEGTPLFLFRSLFLVAFVAHFTPKIQAPFVPRYNTLLCLRCETPLFISDVSLLLGDSSSSCSSLESERVSSETRHLFTFICTRFVSILSQLNVFSHTKFQMKRTRLLVLLRTS